MAISTKFTHADLLVMPDDGKRREIIDGDLYVTPSPRFSHQAISAKLFRAFDRYLDQHPIGDSYFAPLDVILSDLDVLEPDLLFVLNEHRQILQDWVRGAPDLVVEILSPTSAAIDRGPKLKAYARHGVTEYWIVDPEKGAVEIYRLTPEGYQLSRSYSEKETLSSLMLPGFELPVASLFKP
ncbi:MAG: Uma2 family endonuclease [Terriglobia bacterium]